MQKSQATTELSTFKESIFKCCVSAASGRKAGEILRAHEHKSKNDDDYSFNFN